METVRAVLSIAAQHKWKVYQMDAKTTFLNEVECAYCNNFGHEESECRSKVQPKEHVPSSSKVWKKKELQVKNCGIALFAEGEENQWYIDSGCSRHMTGDKNKLLAYSALEKENKVTFGNDTPAVIKGKGSFFLK